MTRTLTKVISGGQTGADIGGLKAAKASGIQTGGLMPAGYLTEAGKRPEYGPLYGVLEHPSDRYEPRTVANVLNSEGTIIFSSNFGSAGSKLTMEACGRATKPLMLIDVRSPSETAVDDVVKWLNENKIQTLNVAGNRESKSPGVGAFVETFLIEVFKKLG